MPPISQGHAYMQVKMEANDPIEYYAGKVEANDPVEYYYQPPWAPLPQNSWLLLPT